MISLWSEKSPGLVVARQNLQQVFAGNQKIEVKSISFLDTVNQNDQIKISLIIEMTGVRASSGRPFAGVLKLNRSFWFAREGTEWKIWKYVPTEEELAAELLAAKDPEERKALLLRRPGLVTPDLLNALNNQGRARRGKPRIREWPWSDREDSSAPDQYRRAARATAR